MDDTIQCLIGWHNTMFDRMTQYNILLQCDVE